MGNLALGAAVDFTAATGGISDAFSGLQTAAITVLGAVAIAGVVLFGGIYAWKYGKKIFNVISK